MADPVAHPAPAATLRVHSVETLAEEWFTLRRFQLRHGRHGGAPRQLTRLSFDRGDRAAVLPHCAERDSVLLTEQLRLPVLLHGDPRGRLLEAPGGLLDGQSAEEAVRREAEEETGVRIATLEPVCSVYLAPQLSAEATYLFLADYHPDDRIGPGGGRTDEGEDIDVVELPLAEAIARAIGEPHTDAKTLLLLMFVWVHGHCPLPADGEACG